MRRTIPIPIVVNGALLVALSAGVAGAPVAQKDRQLASVDLVEIDVAVVDRKGLPVRGLSQRDFTVKDDGKTVEVATFAAVPADPSEPPEPRSVVLLLDDSAAPAVATGAIRAISRGVAQFARPADEIAVVRLNRDADEPFGDRRLAEERIAAFQAATYPFNGYLTQRQSLIRVADIARQIEAGAQHRKIILCVGSPIVCNVDEPLAASQSALWDDWVHAMDATARANVAVYAIVPGRAAFRTGGLVDLTGGELFAATYDVGPAIERILRDADNHYVLGYWPTGKPRELHSVSVKVNRRDVAVHARHRRGR